MTGRFVGMIAGAPLGSRPFDPTSWSGCSQSFFLAAERAELLHRAFGVALPSLHLGVLAARAYSTNREVWRRRVYMSPDYRLALERQMRKVIHPSDYDYPVLQIGAYVNSKRVYGSTVITGSYQDSNNIEYQNSGYAPPSILSDKRLLRDCFSYEQEVAAEADYVFTTSEYTRNSFIQHYCIPPKKVIRVGMGLNFQNSLDWDLSVKDYTQRHIVFIGREFRRKGGVTVVNAFRIVRARFPDARLHVIGPVKIPREIVGTQGIHFHGFLRRHDQSESDRFKEVLMRSTLAVAPSHYEPFGLAPLEAMSYGIPAIVTNQWALAENVQPGATGEHVNVGDSVGLAERIIDLFENPERIATMGKNARETVIRTFSWEKVAKRICHFLHSP